MMQFFKLIKSVLGASDSNPLEDYSDEELVAKYVESRDDDLFQEIWGRHGYYIYGLAYRITQDHHSAEEIFQEVMMQLIQKIDTFKGQSKFSSWLYRVTANASYTFLRQLKKFDKEISLDNYAPYDENGTLIGKIKHKGWSDRPDSVLFSKEAIDVIEKSINELPEPYRVVLILRDVDGFSNNEVSESLEISVPAVKTRLHRARLALRDKISDYFKERGI